MKSNNKLNKGEDDKYSKGEIGKALLIAVGTVGIIGVALVCPNILQLVPRSYRGRHPYHAVRQAIVRMDRRGLIIAKKTESGWKIILTKKGWNEWHAYELGKKTIQIPKKWDKKWRIFIFDIPEIRRRLRDKIRQTLVNLGFVRLQDSVWVHPYECREILDLIRTGLHVRFEALYICAETIDNENWLRKHFNLEK